MSGKPVLTHVTYVPKKGQEEALLTLIKGHWPTIHNLGLATDDPAQIYRAIDKNSGDVHFIEIFSWKDEGASELAHQTPEVMAVWEPMGAVMDDIHLARLEPFHAD